MNQAKPDKPKHGRPETRILKLHCTPEEAFRRIFAAAKPPDPTLRKGFKPITDRLDNGNHSGCTSHSAGNNHPRANMEMYKMGLETKAQGRWLAFLATKGYSD